MTDAADTEAPYVLSDKGLEEIRRRVTGTCECCGENVHEFDTADVLELLDEVDRLRALVARATRFTFGDTDPYAHPHAAIDAAADIDEDDEGVVRVTARPGLDERARGIVRWSVNCGGWVRTHGGRWVDEPQPSDRSEKFMRATRWPDAMSAITLAQELIEAGHPRLPEWETGRRYPAREEDFDD